LSRHFALIIVLSVTVTAFAAPAWQQRPTGYVNDLAGVLSPSTISQLENICQQVDQHGRTQIAVVTVRSLEGQDIESYAVQLFKQWGIGYKGTDRGVLILMAVQDRRYRTEVGYGLEPILPDGKVGGFWREAVPNLRAGDYSAAILLSQPGLQTSSRKIPAFRFQQIVRTFSRSSPNPKAIPVQASSG